MGLTIRNTAERYGLVAQSLHWTVAVLVLTAIGLGLYMTRQQPSPDVFKIYALHKSLGITILGLMILRWVWRLSNPGVRPVPTHAGWEKILSRSVHWFFYLALLAMPLTGWTMSSAHGFSVSVFGLFTMPDLVKANADLAKTLETGHRYSGWFVTAVIGLHIAGALKHHIMDKDRTLRRMLPFGAAILVLIAVPVRAEVPEWSIVPDRSSLKFQARQQGAQFSGTFKKFRGEIRFAPDNLAESRVRIEIPVGSAETGSAKRDPYLSNDIWFDADAHPLAIYQAGKFEKTGEGRYKALGELTLKGVTRDVPLTFSLEIADGTAHAEGEAVLDRTDFKIGSGEWADPDVVSREVKVLFDIMAEKSE